MMGFGAYGNNGGPYSSPSSSNLSASAPPFTIDRSPTTGYMPLVDLLEQTSKTGPLPNSSSLHNWLPPRSPTSEANFFSDPNLDLNSVASSPNNPYNYASLNTHLPHLSTTVSASADTFTYTQPGDNVAKPYYPSYLSPPAQKDAPLVIPDQSSYDWLSSSSHVAATMLDGSSNKEYPKKSADLEYTAQWGGLWNGFSEWKPSKQGLYDGSFCCSKENNVPVSSMYEDYLNQETHIPKGLKRGEEAMRLNRGKEAFHDINILDSERHGGSMNAEKLNDKSFSGKTSNFQPVDYSGSFLGSLSGLPDSSLESSSFLIGTSSGNHQILYGALNEAQLKLHANDSISIAKSSPTPVIGPPAVGCGFSAPNNAPFKTPNSVSDKTDTDLCSKKASSFIHSDGVKHVFDSSQLSVHLEIDDPTSLSSSKNEDMLSIERFTSNTLPHVLKSKCGFQTSNVTHDCFNLDINANENINSGEDSSESVDHFNPAVDSPCWKGAPTSHSFPFDASFPETKKQEVLASSHVQAKQICELNIGDEVYSQKPNDNIRYRESGSPENGLAFPMNTSQVTNSTFGEHKSDDIIKIGCDSETKGIQHSDDIHEHGSRSIGCSNFKISPNTEQNLQGNGLTSENINKATQHVSPCLPYPVGHVISSSVEDASTELNKVNEGPSTPTIDVPTLVSTMHNLSELLLFHCTSGSYQLKRKDLETLQSVIDHLSVCASKNSEKMISIPESSSSCKDTSDHIGGLHKLQKKPQLIKTAGPTQDLLDGQNVREGNKYYMAGKENGEMLDSVSESANLDMVDEDKATQALKKVLTENFHDEEATQPQALLYRNLWLEAEAALCSVSYKARFNRIKIEMEKLKSPKSKDAHEKAINTETNKVSRPEVSPAPNGVNIVLPKAEGCPTTKSQESSVSSTNNEDDVMARFQILRCQAEKSNHGIVANIDKPSSPKVSPHSNKVGKTFSDSQEGNSSPNPDMPTQASCNTSTEKPLNGYEASVMARFHILKSRADNCSPMSTEGQLVETVDGSSIGSRSEFGSLYANPELILQHYGADSTEGQLSGSEFHMLVDNDPLAQSHRTNRRENSLLAGWFDRVSSEWEHVRKEELGLQNR